MRTESIVTISEFNHHETTMAIVEQWTDGVCHRFLELRLHEKSLRITLGSGQALQLFEAASDHLKQLVARRN